MYVYMTVNHGQQVAIGMHAHPLLTNTTAVATGKTYCKYNIIIIKLLAFYSTYLHLCIAYTFSCSIQLISVTVW